MSPMKGILAPRGWYLVGAIVVMTLVALLFGVEELYALAAASGAALVSSAIWRWRHSRLDLTAVTEVDLHRATGGSVASARFVLANCGPRNVPPIAVAVPLRRKLPSPGDSAGPAEQSFHAPSSFCLPGLAPLSQAEAKFRLPTAMRGLWVIGPAMVTLSDPLGLTEKRWSCAAEKHFVVHPEVRALAVLPQLATATRPGVARYHFPAQRGEELHTLRDYQDGDDLRQVHWRATARWDRLMVRQDEADRGCLVCIGLDLRDDRHTTASLEYAVEAAASIASMVLVQPAGELRLATTLGQRWGPSSGKKARNEVLDLLAVASAHGDQASLPLFGGRAEVAVLVSSTESAAFELLARESTAFLRSVIVVLTSEGPSNGRSVILRQLSVASPPVTIVKAAAGLEAAWAAAVGPEPFAQRVVAWASTAAQSQPASP
jgi:uncharacterized protein (DUF58 family)